MCTADVRHEESVVTRAAMVYILLNRRWRIQVSRRSLAGIIGDVSYPALERAIRAVDEGRLVGRFGRPPFFEKEEAEQALKELQVREGMNTPASLSELRELASDVPC